MMKKRDGGIVFISSVSALMANTFSGPYVSSKHAIEGFSASLRQELQEFNVEVVTIQPGPFLTEFNDREFNTWKTWNKTEKNFFNYENISFPFHQVKPEKAIASIIEVITGKKKTYRNVIPKYLIPVIFFVNSYE